MYKLFLYKENVIYFRNKIVIQVYGCVGVD